jgi:flagellar protein FliL
METHMAKTVDQDTDKSDQGAGEKSASSGGKNTGFSMTRLVIIAVPIFIVQAVVIYFLVAKFFVPLTVAQPVVIYETTEAEKTAGDESVGKVYIINDIIINPAGTQGTRFLLTTIGMEVNTNNAYNELERKELQVRDVLNSILTSKRLDELVNVNLRDDLREEIMVDVNRLLQNGKLEHVYFSKFIIQ